jgi:hypothetical protein
MLRILENQNYDPKGIDELRSDIGKELKQARPTQPTLLGLLGVELSGCPGRAQMDEHTARGSRRRRCARTSDAR